MITFTKFKHLILGVGILCSTSIYAQDYYELMNTKGVKLETVQEAAKQYFGDVTPEGISKATGEKISGYKQYKRWEYNAMNHLNADGTVETAEEISDAIKLNESTLTSSKALQASNTNSLQSANTISESNWIELGPMGMGHLPTGRTHGIGRIVALYVSDDQQLIYIGSENGGLWKSINGGNSWSPLADNFEDISIWSIACDPNNLETVYIGTGIGQVLKSTDGGANFTELIDQSGLVRDILINPNNTDEIYVAIGDRSSGDGLFKSTDAGNTWVNLIDGPIEDVLYKPGSTTTLYACGTNFYRSTDGGDSFSQVTNGIVDTDRMRVAVSPADNNVVYVVQANGTLFRYLLKSTDSGVSFSVVTDLEDFNLTGQQSYRNMAIAVNPNDINEVTAGGLVTWRTSDGGSTYELLAKSGNYDPDLPFIHADIQEIEYVNGNLYISSDGGMSRSTDNGLTFTDIAQGLGIHEVFRLASTPSNKNMIAVGAQDNGSSVTTGGTVYDWNQWSGADGGDCMIDPTNTDIIYGFAQGGSFRKTSDGGQTGTLVIYPPENEDGLFQSPMAMDPDDSLVIYTGYNNLYRHDNGAISGTGDWVNCSSGFFGDDKLKNIEVCPTNSNTIYVSTLWAVYKCTNIKSASPTWTELLTTSDRTFVSLGVDPNDENRVVVSTSGGVVFESKDGGSSFTSIESGLPSTSIKAIVLDRSENNGIYAATDGGGVYFKNDLITSWVAFNNNLPNTRIEDMSLLYADSGERVVRIAMLGRGVWESALYDDSIAGEDTLSVDTNVIESLEADNVLIYPNPISKQMHVQLRTQGEIVILSIIDLNGRIINENKFDTHNGLNLLKIDIETISEGSYLLQILKGVKKTTKSIIIR